MPIPDYQTLMLPLLKHLQDGKSVLVKDIIEDLAKSFNLSEKERNELLPSGQAFLFPNRVGWARTYLKKAGLLESPKRGIITITKLGLDVLKRKPNKIDNDFLRQFPEFLEFQNAKKSSSSAETSAQMMADLDRIEIFTPEEIIGTVHKTINTALAQELIEVITKLSPQFFERLVVELLVKMGYGGSFKDASEVVGGTGDEGIDGTIKEDKLGLDVIYIQAKRWQKGNTVGRPELHKFVGALAGQGAKKGIFITTSSFTKEALGYIPRNDTKIVLIDGVQLANFLIEFNLGVTEVRTFQIKRLDSDYFEEG